MEIDNVYQIAKREWDNISISLKHCGHIPKLNFDILITNNPKLIINLNEMDHKITIFDYSTKEAGYVYNELATQAACILGMNEIASKIFGSSYSWVRTGWYSPVVHNYKSRTSINNCIRKQVVFYKMFFPFIENRRWHFDNPEVHSKFKSIYDKFINWQEQPDLYYKEFFIYRTQVSHILEGLRLALNEPLGSC